MIISDETAYENWGMCHGSAPKFLNAKIVLPEKEDNFIFCEAGVILKDSVIAVIGSGNFIYLSKNYYPYLISLRIYRDSTFFMDENNYMNGVLNLLAQEHQNILIGKNGVFSYGIWMMTADAHLIYEIENGRRCNESRGIFLGDHVWLGQFASVTKGTVIGSGSVIGANSVVAGKICPSNTVWAGNPARLLKKGIFWKKDCPNLYGARETEDSLQCSPAEIYTSEGKQTDFFETDRKLSKLAGKHDFAERFRIVEQIRGETEKNRFFVPC